MEINFAPISAKQQAKTGTLSKLEVKPVVQKGKTKTLGFIKSLTFALK